MRGWFRISSSGMLRGSIVRYIKIFNLAILIFNANYAMDIDEAVRGQLGIASWGVRTIRIHNNTWNKHFCCTLWLCTQQICVSFGLRIFVSIQEVAVHAHGGTLVVKRLHNRLFCDRHRGAASRRAAPRTRRSCTVVTSFEITRIPVTLNRACRSRRN